jgi:hypothetical protein
MFQAVKRIRNKETGYIVSYKTNGVIRGTLEGYVKDSKPAEKLVKVHLGRNSCLPSHLEEELAEFCIAMDEWFYGKSSDISKQCYQLPTRNCLTHPFSSES